MFGLSHRETHSQGQALVPCDLKFRDRERGVDRAWRPHGRHGPLCSRCCPLSTARSRIPTPHLCFRRLPRVLLQGHAPHPPRLMRSCYSCVAPDPEPAPVPAPSPAPALAPTPAPARKNTLTLGRASGTHAHAPALARKDHVHGEMQDSAHKE